MSTQTPGKHRAETDVPPDDREAVMGILLKWVEAAGSRGLTVSEARVRLGNAHHGTVSGHLSMLHKHEEIARLADVRRAGCKVYVHPDYVENRETEKQGRGANPLHVALAYWMSPDEGGTRFGKSVATRASKYPQQFAREMQRLWKDIEGKVDV